MSQASKLVCTKLLVISGLAFVAFGLTLGLATYVLPNWYTYTVTANGNSWDQISRTRGIFQECSNTLGLSVSALLPYIIKYSCVDNDVGQYSNQIMLADQRYTTIIRFRQGQLILHGISLLFALIIMMVGLGIMLKWLCELIDSNYYIKWRLALGLLSFLTFLIMASSPALGTVIIYFESWSQMATPYLPYSQNSNNNIMVVWSSMYIAAWVSSGLYLIAALFFLISVCVGSRLEEQKYKPQILSVDNPAFYADDGKTNPNIFFAPTKGSTFGTTFGNVKPNETLSPGLLPRYTIDTK